MSNEFDMESEWITELGKARSDEYTEKMLAFVQELEKSAPEPFLPLLTDLALARTLIVHLVIRYGPERGMAEARDAFESTLEQMSDRLCPRIIRAVPLELRDLDHVRFHGTRILTYESQPLRRLCIVHERRGKDGLPDEDGCKPDSFWVNGVTNGSQNIDQ